MILHGNYRPPVGRLGATLDWLLLRRVARATTEGFLFRLGRAIQQPPESGRGQGLSPANLVPLGSAATAAAS